jgi:hypothetical protein
LKSGDFVLLPGSDRVSINSLSRIFSDMSESYKIFWFSGIMDIIKAGKESSTFGKIIDHMIIDAWYMVSEYRLNLGPADTLEKLVIYAQGISNLKSSATPHEIQTFLDQCDDTEFLRYKATLCLNVPYRLQAPFMSDLRGSSWNRTSNVIERVNGDPALIYHFGAGVGLEREIRIQPEWQAYLSVNQAIVSGWIELNLIQYLQKRNPSVPGISNKIFPPSERKLEKAKKFWKSVIEYEPIRNIYASDGSKLTPSDISLDHFIPWSYVAHDELWNLVPTTKSLNSSKSDDLPNWDIYFPRLCEIEYASYTAIWLSETIHDLFDKCSREHVNSNEAKMKLYQRGISEHQFSESLQELIFPTYTAARNMGFPEWRQA